MNAYEKSIAMNLSGTDAEIVAQLRPITARAIDLAYLMEMLNFRGMLRKTDGAGGQERWQGTLPNLKAALVALNQTDAVTQYETWFSHVTNPRQSSWDTSRPEYAAAFYQLEQSFADQPNMPTAADFEAVAQLGGGRPYLTLTEQEYATQKQSAIDAKVDSDAITAKQGWLAEANDSAQNSINNDPGISQADVLAAFTVRLAEVWQ